MPLASHLIWFLFSDLATLLVPDCIETPVLSATLQTHPALGSVWFSYLVPMPPLAQAHTGLLLSGPADLYSVVT